MPGRAIGSTSTNEIVSRPKNVNLWTANAASEPRTSAIVVAPKAARIEFLSAPKSKGSCQAARNHSSVHRLGGHPRDTPLLNA